jgi:hypothetical protein
MLYMRAASISMRPAVRCARTHFADTKLSSMSSYCGLSCNTLPALCVVAARRVQGSFSQCVDGRCALPGEPRRWLAETTCEPRRRLAETTCEPRHDLRAAPSACRNDLRAAPSACRNDLLTLAETTCKLYRDSLNQSLNSEGVCSEWLVDRTCVVPVECGGCVLGLGAELCDPSQYLARVVFACPPIVMVPRITRGSLPPRSRVRSRRTCAARTLMHLMA